MFELCLLCIVFWKFWRRDFVLLHFVEKLLQIVSWKKFISIFTYSLMVSKRKFSSSRIFFVGFSLKKVIFFLNNLRKNFFINFYFLLYQRRSSWENLTFWHFFIKSIRSFLTSLAISHLGHKWKASSGQYSTHSK